MKRIINAVIQLRRDNEYNFNKIADSFIPANGEVILVDTAKNGLRAKVGDGFSTFAQLNYTDEDLRNAVLHGWYYNGVFYRTSNHDTVLEGMINKLYIDDATYKVYFYNGSEYVRVSQEYVTATAETPGLVKLYGTVGQNVDGTMTQKAITDELDLRYKANIDRDEELLIFSL